VKRKPPPVAEELEWWRRRVVKWGAAVGALVVLLGAGRASVSFMDARNDGRYALAADVKDVRTDVKDVRGDVQQIQGDVLELRRDSLDAERRELQRAQRQRKLSDPEIDRLQKLNDLISQIDRRLESLREKKAGK
jgi:hypothetical protein